MKQINIMANHQENNKTLKNEIAGEKCKITRVTKEHLENNGTGKKKNPIK